MAGAFGNVGTYGTDAPLNNNAIGDALTQVENVGFRNRQEQLAKDKLKREKDDADLKELDEYNKKFGVNITGNQSIDDTTTGYAMRAKQEVGDLTRQIQQTTDFNKKSQLMALRSKKVQSFDILKQIPDMLIKQGDEIAKGVEAGKYDPESVNLIQDKFKSLEQGKVHYYTDDAGNLRFTTYKVNDAGEPVGVIDKDQSVAELLKSLNPDLKSNYRDIVSKYHNEYKPDVITTTDANGTKIVDGRVNMNKGSKDYINAQENAVAILSTPTELKKVSKISGIPTTDLEGLKNYVTNDLLSGVKSTYENSKDASLMFQKSKDAKDRAEKVVQATNARIDDDIVDQLMTTANEKGQGKGTTINRVSKNSLYRNAVAFPKLPFKNLGGENSGLNSGFIEVVTKEKGTGKFIVKGKALKTKGEKFKLGDKTVDYFGLQEEANNGNEEAQLALSSYGKGDNYSTFVRTVGEDELAPLIGQTSIKTIDNLSNRLEKMNPNANKSAKASTEAKTQSQWNSEWSKLQKGESMIGLDGKTYTKR